MTDAVYYLDATELAALIRNKQLSAVEVVRAHLDRIETINPRSNAIVTLLADQALAAAHRHYRYPSARLKQVCPSECN